MKPLWRPVDGVELETTTTPSARGTDGRDACRHPPLTLTRMTRPRWPSPTRLQRGVCCVDHGALGRGTEGPDIPPGSS